MRIVFIASMYIERSEFVKGRFVERMARMHGDGEVHVNYRHAHCLKEKAALGK